jgi:hypothetical protein
MKTRKRKTTKSAKVLPIVLAASISTEAALAVRHEDGVESPSHTESAVKHPSHIAVTAKSSDAGAGRAVSATLSINPHEAVLPEQPHVEPIGGGMPATGLDLNQRS